jgi:spore maturation protein CgeB
LWKTSRRNKAIFPEVNYHKELPIVYNTAKINLNITVSKLKAGVSQRIFDIFACEGFLLTDYRSCLFRHFEPEEELYVTRMRRSFWSL